MPDPTPPAISPSVAPTQPKPGYKTTEFWLTSLAMVLGQLYAGGVISDGGKVSVIAGHAVTILGLLGYTVIRGQLKTAHLNASALSSAPGASFALARSIAPIAVLALFMSIAPACTSAQKAEVKTAVNTAISCAKVDFDQVVGPGGATVLATVAETIATGGEGWLAALDKLAATIGMDAVACATKAVGVVLVAHPPTTEPTTAMKLAGADRAREAIVRHGWTFTK